MNSLTNSEQRIADSQDERTKRNNLDASSVNACSVHTSQMPDVQMPDLQILDVDSTKQIREESIRDLERKSFLQKSFSSKIENFLPVQGDAGLRSYFRFNSGARTYILMDCLPSYSSLEPFINIARYLNLQGFSAPEIFYSDHELGFLVIEDFGTVNLKNFINKSSNDSVMEIYESMIDLLVLLQSKSLPEGLEVYSNEMLLSELNIFINYYAPYILKRDLNVVEIEEYKSIWQDILNQGGIVNNSLVLRDYHVENIMYLENRDGLKKLGLLDFQDAINGSPIYDLVSILEDARTAVPRELSLFLVGYFAKQKNLDLELVLKNYHILGAQRNSRILGVFVRKLMRDNNADYLKYLPLVRQYLSQDLSHPVMSPLKTFLNKISL